MNRLFQKFILLTLSAGMLWVTSGCASKALLTDTYAPDDVRITQVQLENSESLNPTILLMGDSQPSWRVIEKFYKKENVATWWQLAVPFYQVYWIGNGIIGGINYLRFYPDAGHQERVKLRTALEDAIQSDHPDAILHVGDMAGSDGRYAEHWDYFLDDFWFDHKLFREIPVLTTIGNHEWANDTTFGFPNYEAVTGTERFYTVEFRDAVLIVMDSNFLVDQWGLIPDDEQDALFNEWFVSEPGEEASWLEKQLDTYKDKAFKIISMHHPPVTFGWHEKDWYKENNGRELVSKRRRFLDTIRQGGVQLILSGHEHIYEHVEVHFDSDDDTAEPLHIAVVTGGTMTRQPPGENAIAEMQQKYDELSGLNAEPVLITDKSHYGILEITDEKMTVRVLEVKDDGAVVEMESFSIKSPGSQK